MTNNTVIESSSPQDTSALMEAGFGELEGYLFNTTTHEANQDLQSTPGTELPATVDIDGSPIGSTFPRTALELVLSHNIRTCRIERRDQDLRRIRQELEVATLRLKSFIITQRPATHELLSTIPLEELLEEWEILGPVQAENKRLFLELRRLLDNLTEEQEGDIAFRDLSCATAMDALRGVFALCFEHPRGQALEKRAETDLNYDEFVLPPRPLAPNIASIATRPPALTADHIATIDAAIALRSRLANEFQLAELRVEEFKRAHTGPGAKPISKILLRTLESERNTAADKLIAAKEAYKTALDDSTWGMDSRPVAQVLSVAYEYNDLEEDEEFLEETEEELRDKGFFERGRYAL